MDPHRHRFLTEHRVRRHLVVLAILLWAVAIFSAATPTWRLRTGQIKGTDFVHFYTLARIGQSGASLGFADLNAQRTMQLAARPESVDDWYPPAYGPQVTVALSPLGYLSYGQALTLWLLLTTVAYLVLIRGVIRICPTLARRTGLAMLGAIAFPPFFELILHGQLSIVAMAAMIWAWVALRRGRVLLAGAALGLLGYKLSLLLPVLAILAVAGLWRMLGAALVVAIGQVLLGAWASGSGSLTAYVQMLADSPRLMNTLAAKPYQMHSWRAFWLLLFDAPRLSLGLYVLCSIATVAMVAQIWRRTSDPSRQMAALAIGTVLCAPHLYVYDLVLLAPVWLWLIDWYLSRPDVEPAFGWLLYAGYAAPLASPLIARFGHIQLSTLCLVGLLAYLWRYSGGESLRNSQLHNATTSN
jgi:hypothetical protein